MMVSANVAVLVPAELDAVKVTDDVPGVVGVPEISPVAVLIDNPVGKPVAPKTVGLLEAVIWYENELPTVPFAVLELVITGTTAFAVTVSVAVPAPVVLLALNVTGIVPVELRVPEINPVAVLMDNPPGKPDAPKLVGSFVAVIWYEKELPTSPLAALGLVIAGVAWLAPAGLSATIFMLHPLFAIPLAA